MKKAASASPAAWIIERLHDFAEDVGSLVPEGFDAYARIFHPAWEGGPEGNAVAWEEIAAWTGRVLHSEAQWPHIAFAGEVHDINALDHPPPGAHWESAPTEGSLDRGVAERLVRLLAGFTSTPERCWFAFWDGWGIPMLIVPPGEDEPPDHAEFVDAMKERERAPRFAVPGRDLLLFEGPIEACLDGWHVASGNDYQSPTLWWPDDRAWCVATDVDLESTYVGGSTACVDAVVADAALEALPVDIRAGITWDSDRINPNPLRLTH